MKLDQLITKSKTNSIRLLVVVKIDNKTTLPILDHDVSYQV